MSNNKKLAKYIDQLNSEKMPKEHREASNSEEMEELMETVRKVRSLKEPVLPDADYPKHLAASLNQPTKVVEFNANKLNTNTKKNITKRILVTAGAVAAAAVILVTSVNLMTPNNTSIAHAMVQAFEEVKAYHGILEIVGTNQLGEEMTQARREIWADRKGNYYIKELEGFSEGLITVNNGQRKWQIKPDEQSVYLFSVFPDPYRFTFELGEEIEDVKNALSIKEIGVEMISGREAAVLEVTPEGGDPYKLWIDKETDLPLQRQSAMQNALQYRVTYYSIEFIDEIPQELLIFIQPESYELVEVTSEQLINNLEEAQELAGFTPEVPESLPKGYKLKGISILADSNAVRLYYNNTNNNTVIIQQKVSKGDLKPAANAIIGLVNNGTAEILTSMEAEGGFIGGSYDGLAGIGSIRWLESGLEYQVLGDVSIEVLSEFAEGVSDGKVIMPSKEQETNKPQIEVPYDIEVEKNEQKSVDAGHSPWRLDPVFVAQVFASLLVSPEGITGDYPIAYDDIKIVENNGVEAVAEISGDSTPARKVYLKRLVRQDETGIWTVVGYDPAK